jgi:hypothetical protein
LASERQEVPQVVPVEHALTMQLCDAIRQSCGCRRTVRRRTIITIVRCCSMALEGGRTAP